MTSDAANNQILEGETATFTLTASKASATDITLSFALAVGDVTAADSGTSDTNMADFASGAFNNNGVEVTLLAGSTTATFTVIGENDGVTELPEAYKVTATIVDGQTLTSTVSLLDGAGTFKLT